MTKKNSKAKSKEKTPVAKKGAVEKKKPAPLAKGKVTTATKAVAGKKAPAPKGKPDLKAKSVGKPTGKPVGKPDSKATGKGAKTPPVPSKDQKLEHEKQKKLLDSHRQVHHQKTEAVLEVAPRAKLQFYTLADVRDYLASRKKSGNKLNLWVPEEERKARERAAASARAQGSKAHNVAAASIADLFGGSGISKKSGDVVDESKQIPEKYRRYYRLLVDMRAALQEGVAFHSEEALKKNGKEDSGDLSGYSQHLADAGTDTADRDFALSLISNEQETLKEIADAIERMKRQTYGVCEITQKAIPHARLMAVPFTRYSLEGQKELERNRRANRRRGAGNPLGEISDEVGFGTGGGGGEDEPSES